MEKQPELQLASRMYLHASAGRLQKKALKNGVPVTFEADVDEDDLNSSSA
jgi:hypothetical protein